MATQTYTVKQGDTLGAIAQRYGVRTSDITGYKSGDPNRINVGENLTLNLGGISPGSGTVPNQPKPMTSSDLEKATNLPDATTFTQLSDTPKLSDKVSLVASATLDSNKKMIDELRKSQQDEAAAAVNAKQDQVDQYKNDLVDLTKSTLTVDAFDKATKQFKIKENIAALADIQQKIVSAQEALNMGLIYEGDRPARQRLIQGRSASLQKQGLATIGALQGTAEVIKGNIDLGMSYAQATVDAINQDNQRSLSALQTLLNLSNSDLVQLKKEERDAVESRIKDITTEVDRLQQNKDDVMELMTKYPKAFAAGGVTLLDTKEDALRKMLPTLAADEKAKFDGELAAKSRVSSSEVDKAKQEQYKSQLLQAKSNGMSYDEAVLAFGDVLDVADIAAFYGRKAAGTGTAQDSITDAYYNQFIDPTTGNVKPGYSVSIDPKNGRPIVTETKKDSGTFFGNLWKSLTGKK